jgi:hypothetical protein
VKLEVLAVYVQGFIDLALIVIVLRLVVHVWGQP